MGAAQAGPLQRLEELAGVTVPLEIEGRNVDEALRLLDQSEAPEPFAPAVAQRLEGGRGQALGYPSDLGPPIERVREGREAFADVWPQSRYPPATSRLTPVT